MGMKHFHFVFTFHVHIRTSVHLKHCFPFQDITYHLFIPLAIFRMDPATVVNQTTFEVIVREYSDGTIDQQIRTVAQTASPIEMFHIGVHTDTIDASTLSNRHLVQGTSSWKAGDILSVTVEAHTTVKMLKQSISETTSFHPTLQMITFGGGCDLAETTLLQDIGILVSLGGGMQNALEEASSMGYFFDLRILQLG